MAWCGFNVYGKCGGFSAESLGAEVEGVYFVQKLCFHLLVELVGVFLFDFFQEGFFAQQAALFETAS